MVAMATIATDRAGWRLQYVFVLAGEILGTVEGEERRFGPGRSVCRRTPTARGTA